MQRQKTPRRRELLRAALRGPQAPAPGSHRWLPDSRFQRDLLFNLAVGGVVLLVLHALPQWSWLGAREDQALDWMVRMHAGVSPEHYEGAPFVLIDLDEPTYRGWGEPFHVPRDRLARLIAFAVESDAALVLVDVDLSRRAGPEDAPLERYLAGFAREGGISQGPQIVLARTFREPWPPGSSPWREQRLSFLDPIVAAAPDLHWASTLFLRESDLRIRRFRNLEPTCNDGRAEVVPAMQLLAVALLLERERGPARMTDALSPHRPSCAPDASPAPVPDRTLRLGRLEIALLGSRVSSRILYDFGGEAGDATPSVPFRGGRVPLLTRLPAWLVEDASEPSPLLSGRVAIVGASYADSRDIQRTPLGSMPGALVLANAIHSLIQNGGLKPPGTAVVVGVQLLLLGLASLVFALVNSYLAALVAMPLTFAVLLPLSFWMFRYGAWLDLAIPLGVLQILVVARKYRERYSHVRAQLNRMREETSESAEDGHACREASTQGPAGSHEPPRS